MRANGFQKTDWGFLPDRKFRNWTILKSLRGYGWKNFRRMKLWQQDKGHRAEIKAFPEAVQNGGPSPIPFEEVVAVSKTMIDLSQRT